ncbi:amino acid adenylation domain-containing protein [Rhizobium leguminosarum]|uniref:amino acid adenylation domain-containing protein n=1 Tax=Rhizobium leguminosarum TaxID=384 RepID=UPI003ECCE7DA
MTQALASSLKLPAARLDEHAPLGEYGVDSVIALQLTHELEKSFGSLSKTLLFEYQSIRELTQYFLETHRPKLNTLLGGGGAAVTASVAEPPVAPLPRMALRETPPRAALLRAPIPAERHAEPLDIAIIGVSGRYPGARNLEEFWENLRNGRDCITEVPKERWDHSLYFDPDRDKQGKTYCKWGGFIDGVDQFDPLFFNMSPREAELLDPQERLFLEIVWDLLESTGHTTATMNRIYQRKVGVYVGAMYQQYRASSSDAVGEALTSLSSYSAIANRVSHAFDLIGPSIAIDTMCSSAAFAIHMAVEALNCGECNLAIAGGVNLSIRPSKYVGLSALQLIGSHPDSRSFADGDGYLPAETVGAVLLKPLGKAVEDGDSIMAVIKSSATNHGGRSNGYAVPNLNAQAQLFDDVLQKAGIEPRTISAIEAAANGSALADAIEFRALEKVFKRFSSENGFCSIGSVKSNIGHAEAASAISQLSKIILQLQNRKLAPTIKAELRNPAINFDESPFVLQTTLEEWKRPVVSMNGRKVEFPRRAMLNAFGAGGSNVSMIVEEYCPANDSNPGIPDDDRPHVIVCSAKSDETLNAVAHQLLSYVQSEEQVDLRNLEYTLQVAREPMRYRLALVVTDRDELIQGLSHFINRSEQTTERAASIQYYTGNMIDGRTGWGLVGEDIDKRLVQLFLGDGSWDKLGMLWSQGVSISWELLYKQRHIKKLKLPTYPFVRRRYWIPMTEVSADGSEYCSGPIREALPERVSAHGADIIEARIGQYLSRALKISQQDLNRHEDLRNFGLDSVGNLRLKRFCENYFKIDIPGREVLTHKSIEDWSTYLETRLKPDHVSATNGYNSERLIVNNAAKTDRRDQAWERANIRAMDAVGSRSETNEKDERERSRLSEGQKGLWLIQKLEPSATALNLPLCFRVRGPMDLRALEGAFQLIQKLHPGLSGKIVEEGGVPYWVQGSEGRFSIDREDISGLAEDAVVPYLRRLVKEPFLLEEGPLLRGYILTRGASETILLLVVHHIVFDGKSAQLLLNTLFATYRALASGRPVQIAPPEASYSDFVAWEQELLAGERGQAHLAYWREQLTGPLPVLDLPVDHPRHSSSRTQGQTESSSLTAQMQARIQEFAHAQGVSPAVIFLSVYKLLLHRYTGQQDIVVGMPTLGRPEERFEDIVGYFVNMLAMRSQPDGTTPFAEFLQAVQLTLADGLDHAEYPFPALVRELKVPRMAGQSPVFQVTFAYQNASVMQMERSTEDDALGSAEPIAGVNQEGEYELVLEVNEQPAGYVLNFKYDPELFEPSTIARMVTHYLTLLEGVIADPHSPLAAYQLLTPEEQQTVLVEWNNTKAEYPPPHCVHELFEQQAQHRPDAVAVRFGDHSLTYRELDAKSEILALNLQRQGVRPNQLVGIYLERSLDMLVGLLGVLKAGGAYVPLDPDYPGERLRYMLQDSQVSLVLTKRCNLGRVQSLLPHTAQAVIIDEDEAVVSGIPIRQRDKNVTSLDLAYVIYTSGSTGNPKGVMVSHRSLTNLLMSMAQHPGLGTNDILLAVTTLSFDIAGLELYLPLIQGAQCVIASAETARDAVKLKAEIERIRPTIMQATPTTWAMLFQIGWRNDERLKILCGGDALPEDLKERIIATDSKAWNLYGPTETTIWSTVCQITADVPVSIGTPIANTQLYVLDPHLQPVPTMIPGELYIGGDGLSKGYLNRAELTADRFIQNPFSPTSKLYKTGDLVRWQANGQMEHLGRLDTQVKVRGYRIELGEIERRLTEHATVRNCAVVVHDAQGHKQLIAYCVGEEQHGNEWRDYLKSCLPEFMLPARFVTLDILPVTPNGKLDRKALAQRQLPAIKTVESNVQVFKDPNDRSRHAEIEDRVLAIWREVLHVEDIRLEDGFFDIGGDSFLALTVAQRIAQNFICEFDVTAMFRYGTIKNISQHLADELGPIRLMPEPAKIISSSKEVVPSNEELSYPSYYQNGLAIIGISCQFPGAEDHRSFWNNLKNSRESVQFFSKEDLIRHGVPNKLINNKNYVAARSAIDGKELFDPAFFRISPKDTELMDPQLRLLLQHAWKATEDAGYVSRDIPDTSVFMSASSSGYGNTSTLTPTDAYLSWMLAQSGTIPTIISNKLGFKGPSYAVHSNCSSSLVGLYAAQQAIRTGESNYALVGASTLFPDRSIGYVHQPGMNFSSDGHVRTFDAAADGMIGGEGVAVILVKAAAKAVADGDHIYAIIREVALNNDGADKAGFYAPSVRGQSEVIEKVLSSTGIDPKTIGYVEAHGTGTELGDPIEFAALRDVYTRYTSEKQFCGLGSVKTNIGHLDTAAGLAGCIKLALCLEHGEMVPTLNYTAPNPSINLEDSPFYVVDSLLPWQGTDGQPRRAALSSFGIGGTNTHAILEQVSLVPPRASAPVRPHGPVAVVLSAKNEERLQAQAAQLIQAVEARGFTDADLADIAYTLQIGREAMEVRLALVADSLEEMTSKLHRYSQGDEQIEGLYRGEVRRAKDMLAPFNADEDLRKAIEAWVAKGKLSKLLDLWVKGLAFDWNSLYAAHKPRRISLPTYPFARERYWVPANATEDSSAATASVAAVLHPLLHENTSDLWGQRFRTRFGGEEFFLRDHVVQGEKVLPAAAQLEMARAAVSRAARDEAGDGGLHLRDVAWARPVRLGSAPLELHVGVYTEDDGAIAYEILGGSDGDGEPVVYGQGRALLAALDAPPAVDIAGVRAQCERTMSASECYAAFEALGISYGPAHRGMTALHVGSQQALARLELPAGTATAEYVLHPSLMDAALQATLGLRLDASSQAMLELPFAVEAVDILSAVPAQAWAWVRFSAGSNAASAVGKLDIDLCDEQGRVCVSMRGFSTRAVQGQLGAEEDGTLLMRRLWRPQAATTGDEPGFVEHRVVLFDAAEDYRADITAALPGVECLVLGRTEASIAQRYETGVERVLEALQSIVRQRPKGAVLLQVVVALTGEGALLEGLSGLLKTARLENPNLVGQVIGLEAGTSASTVVAQLLENAATPAAQQIRYRSGERLVLDWEELPSGSDGRQPWRDRGVYLITGGAGGLGLIFAREIASRVKDPTLILVGRSALSVAKQAELAALETLGARVQYQRLDVSDGAAVTALVAQIRQAHGELTGIVHGAGVIKDSFLVKKTADEVRAVLSPKVAGVVNLDEATRDVALEFMILFASGSGALGNVGQGDYAAANAFLEGYASYRNGLVASGNRQGRTLAIAWPLWRHGGMQVDAAVAQLQQQQGVVPLSTQRGLQAFYGAYVAGDDQVLVLSGEVNRLRASLLQQGSPAPQEASLPNDSFVFGAEPEQLKEKTLERLKGLLAEATKLALSQIDVEEPLESYGIDSIMITRLNHKFGEIFGELSKTLLYEYQTLDSLADYLVGQHAAACARWSGLKKAVPAQPPLPRAADARQEGFAALSRMKLPRARSRTSTQASSRLDRVPIAIIGLDGRYPKAANLDAYWQNLEAGRDCIGEIPSERWPLSGFYHPDPQEATAQGKSYSKWGGFLEGFAEFDPLFFSIPPLQAENMDPQERLFLQCAYAVLEDAGYTRQRLTEAHQRRVGVFAGITTTGFDLYGPELWRQGQTSFPYTSFSSLANRVSYFFDLQGPSLPIDTMCSSSLTAIHEACEHLLRGECELAIAGGVNLFLHPASYVTRSAQRMLSGDGRCKSFGKGGNGYVPGEGVGAVLLKPLPRAIEDDDQIYGVIRATSINHGGKTNGYTVPNPTAQRELVREAMEKAGIDARTISYIEAHGTGTELGDPIEITGLAQAFQQDTTDAQFCAIGSVKSNIGHLEAAAGIAAVTKVLLQLKHQQLAPSLHAEELNPNIDFAKTPFTVQQSLGPWARPVVEIAGRRQEYPRIAGISSFGAGGANAHIIIEEYVPAPRASAPVRPHGPVAVVLSAKNEERLQAQAAQLIQAVEARGFTDADLADIAYTLQIGREAMEVRLALVADSLEEMTSKLHRYSQGDEQIEGLYRGEVRRAKDMLAPFNADEDLRKAIEAWVAKGKLSKLLDLWVKGLAFDWNSLYAAHKPRRISLPTYPFARERYWVPANATPQPKNQTTSPHSIPIIHPLLHENVSDLNEQKYSSTFNGEEFFLRDHVVQGEKVLPAAAQLEMARAAIEKAAGGQQFKAIIELKDIVFTRPVIFSGTHLKLNIKVKPAPNGAIAYTINHEKDGEEITCCEGRAQLSAADDIVEIGLERLKAICQDKRVGAGDCYHAFTHSGISYGDAFRGLKQIFVGQDPAGEPMMLGELNLPHALTETLSLYSLHPSILDAALQTTIGFALASEAGGSGRPALPFAVESLQVFSPPGDEAWAVVRCSPDSAPDSSVSKLNIQIADGHGRLCASLVGYSSRTVEGTIGTTYATTKFPSQTSVDELTIVPQWDIITDAMGAAWPSVDRQLLILGGTAAQQQVFQDVYPSAQVVSLNTSDSVAQLSENLGRSPIAHLIWIAPTLDVNAPATVTAQKQDILLGFRLIKALLALGYDGKTFGLTVITQQAQAVLASDTVRPSHAGIHGLIGSLAKEYRHWNIRLLDLPDSTPWPVADIFTLPSNSEGNAMAYRSGEWYSQKSIKCKFLAPVTSAFRQNGVYVILGGAGGIGEVFTETLIRGHQAQVIWIGRRKEDEVVTAKRRRLSAFGPTPHYIAADATDLEALSSAYEEVKLLFGGIHGVVHSTVVLKDKSLARMEEDDFASALAAKADVCINLAEVFKDETLDFALFFSSLESIAKSPGQSNYAAGCAYVDAHAQMLKKTWTCPVKVINWGYWGSVGVVATSDYRLRMERARIGSIEAPEAMFVLERLLASSLDQIGYIKITESTGANRLNVVPNEFLTVL